MVAQRALFSSSSSIASKSTAASDHLVSRRRSSQGKSNRMASIPVVSSIETLSTQSKVSPTGRLSSSSTVRRRMSWF